MNVIREIPLDIELEMRVRYSDHPKFANLFFDEVETITHYGNTLLGYVECFSDSDDLIVANVDGKKYVPWRKTDTGYDAAYFLKISDRSWWDIAVGLEKNKPFAEMDDYVVEVIAINNSILFCTLAPKVEK